MQPIQAIIIYNGGSAGDFLKTICNRQLARTYDYEISNQGAIETRNHYFKGDMEALYQKQLEPQRVSQWMPIENTHYYLDGMTDFSKNLFFIDYPDHLQDFIVDRLCNTRFHNDPEWAYQFAIQYLPESIKKRVDRSDTKTLFKVAFARNLRLWRQNPALRAVQLADIVHADKLPDVVRTVCGLADVNAADIQSFQKTWLDRNGPLSEIFLQSTHDRPA